MKAFGSAVILAGGRGLRMGCAKSRLTVNGNWLLEKQVELLKPIFSDILISASPEQPVNVAGCRSVYDLDIDCGPLGGIVQGLIAAESNHVYFTGCDMPVINTAYIAFMMGNIIQEKPEVCVTANGKFIEPLNAFYSRPLIPLISSLLGSGFKSLHHLFRSCHTLTIPEFQARSFDGCFEMFTNLNTREDLARFASSGVNHKNRDSQVVERMVGFMPKNLVAA